MKLQAAISPCPNDVFIFSGLITGESYQSGDPEFEFSFLELETLNLGVQAGQWDFAKTSYANFPFCEDQYSLLRCGGALGRACGPLLLSNRPTWNSNREVLIPGQFTTAHFLFDYFIQTQGLGDDAPLATGKMLPVEKKFLAFDKLYQQLQGSEACQGVVIHEMRFTYASDGLCLIRDLGEYWEQSTGFPIPLGAVVLNKRLEAGNRGFTPMMEGLIRKSLNWAYLHPEQALDLCRQHSQSLSESVLKAHIDLYVNAFTEDLGPDGEAAVAFFLDRHRKFRTRS